MPNSVSNKEEQTAQKNGVILIYLDPKVNLKGHAKKVTAISYRTGRIIRNDNETWVRSELKRMDIKIIKEF